MCEETDGEEWVTYLKDSSSSRVSVPVGMKVEILGTREQQLRLVVPGQVLIEGGSVGDCVWMSPVVEKYWENCLG